MLTLDVIMLRCEISNPHPFISILMPIKGKKMLPRLSRHLSSQQMLTMLTLLVACFNQLDVVVQAPLLDSAEETPERKEVDRQTQAFLGSVMQSVLPIVAKSGLRLISGLLGLLLDRSNIVMVTQTRVSRALSSPARVTYRYHLYHSPALRC
jgi:DNA topoisomerase 2-associated protein PAT1